MTVDINQKLVATLRDRFADRHPQLAKVDGNLLITFPAELEEVGDVKIYDDGAEFTLSITNITHIHFEHHNDPEIGPETITGVVEFLADLFADKILMWTGPGGSGGTQHVEYPGNPVGGKNRYFWSQPAT